MLYDRMRVEQEWAPVGIVRQAEPLVIESRNVLEVGNSIEYLGRNFVTISCIVTCMTLEDGTIIERANPGSRVVITTEPPIPEPEPTTIFRKKLTQ
jgi:putative protease